MAEQMSNCKWCGSDYKSGYIVGYCSKKCAVEEHGKDEAEALKNSEMKFQIVAGVLVVIGVLLFYTFGG
ncbi:MAG TPA: hypothetical protein VFM78_01385 [Marinobacter sp.]|nr:hypothetical protein [Marinobacter sp.]